MFDVQYLQQNDENRATHPFRMQYANADQQVPEPETAGHLLACISFDQNTSRDQDNPGCLTIGLPNLDPLDRRQEIWHASSPVSRGFEGDIAYNLTDDVLFAHILIDESGYDDIEQAASHGYEQLLRFVQRQNYPHLLRIWNYFPGINENNRHAVERYKTFCAGRHDALMNLLQIEQELPAASAIGTNSKGLLIYLIAAKQPGIQVENPRQVSAFKYPPIYGNKSPSFSRATYKAWGDNQHFYVSGTASVVGHETRHPDDKIAQLDETLVNIQSLLDECHKHDLPVRTIQDLTLLKVYVRDPRDYAAIRRHLNDKLNGKVPLVILQGDICRSDLLLELEGIYTTPAG